MNQRWTSIIFYALLLFGIFLSVKFSSNIGINEFHSQTSGATFLPKNNIEIRTKRFQFNITEIDIRRQEYNRLITRSKGQERIKRLPDVIGIGVGKCGTGALQSFLSNHPLMRTSGEVHYYNKFRERGLEYYRSQLRSAFSDEIVMEKTPAYFLSMPYTLPSIIKRDLPNVKLLLLLCNPSQRMLSRYAMRDRNKSAMERVDFGDFVRENLPRYSRFFLKLNGTEEEQTYGVLKMCESDPYFAPGVYSLLIRRWKAAFNPSRMLIINGEEFLRSPGRIIEKIQRFLGLPPILLKKDFVRNPISNLFCVRPWWNKRYDFKKETLKLPGWENNLKCLGSGKGRTRSSHSTYKMKRDTRNLLNSFYEPYNRDLSKMLHRDFFL